MERAIKTCNKLVGGNCRTSWNLSSGAVLEEVNGALHKRGYRMWWGVASVATFSRSELYICTGCKRQHNEEYCGNPGGLQRDSTNRTTLFHICDLLVSV